jgi:hypothetical protein
VVVQILVEKEPNGVSEKTGSGDVYDKSPKWSKAVFNTNGSFDIGLGTGFLNG